MSTSNTTVNQNIEDELDRTQLRVATIEVRNFRLLRNVDVDLDDQATVLVGRNNTGKTTLAEIFDYFLQAHPPKFDLADFSTETYEQFYRARGIYFDGSETEARESLPEIALTIKIAYDADLSEYGPLHVAIVDLDLECTEAILHFTYSLKGGRLSELFEGLGDDFETGVPPDIETVLGTINARIPKLYGRAITAIDPNDPSNTRDVPVEAVQKLITVHFLKAQRGLDDEKERPKDPIGKVFQALFNAAACGGDGTAHKETAEKLTEAISDIEHELGESVSEMMTGIVPALESFGYPGLNNPDLEAETILDIERLLANYTSIRYRGVAGISLPESYSGLGPRNLILMLLTLLGYYREFASREGTPGLHLVFIEEPEAHLHPQMQEVLIEQLSGIAGLFPVLDKQQHSWRPQFVVSTHSSHVANRAEFSAVRYFRIVGSEGEHGGSHADVLDLSSAPGLDADFLHQYLTLTRSDLFFADKAILVEGTSERLIVPAAIKKTAHSLANQYVTLMEVGGAYAHIFFPLLDFLGIPALIITDIDAVGAQEGKTQKVAKSVHQGDGTSNATINQWYSGTEPTPTSLLESAETQAIISHDRYLAYQVPEDGQAACGRTFEDAFILANPALFGLTVTDDVNENEDNARELARTQKKSAFALRFAIQESNWTTPRYIQRGLDWLSTAPADSVVEVDNAASVEVAVKRAAHKAQ